jgi:hypothetical protein
MLAHQWSIAERRQPRPNSDVTFTSDLLYPMTRYELVRMFSQEQRPELRQRLSRLGVTKAAAA